MPSKTECESAIQKKQPPKTRPKPKSSVVMAAQSCDAVKSRGVSQSVANVVSQNEKQPSGRANHKRTGTDDVLAASIHNASNSSHIMLDCEHTTASSGLVTHANDLPSDATLQRTRVWGKSASRDEVDVVRPSVKRSMMNRWASTSSLMYNAATPAANDVEEAINRAKQKPVLYRIVGMKLEGESLPQQMYKAASDHALSDTPRSLAATNNTKPSVADTDDVGLSSSTPTDCRSTSADVTSQPHPLADALVQPVVTERNTNTPISETLSTAETAIMTEENGSTQTESAARPINTHVSKKSCRPTSLYPQDTDDSSLTAIDVHSSMPNTDDNSTLETLQPDNEPTISPPLRDAQSPPTENRPTATVTSIKHPQVTTSRKSYIALSEFVLDKFSFLDNVEATTERHSNTSDCGAADARPTSSSDPAAISAATTAAQDRHTETEQTTERTIKNERPKSLLRKSIILPNGEILEIVGNAFTFLDEYDEQIANDFAC